MKMFLNKQKTIVLVSAVCMWFTFFTGCSQDSDDSNSKNDTTEEQSTEYEDMLSSFEQSGLLSSNIGIFSKVESDGNTSYENGGSGVIIKKTGDTYYAMTAAHVVSTENAQLLVYTVNTNMTSEEIPGMEDVNVLPLETYESMYSAKVEYTSTRDDFAVISFSCDEELAVADLAESDPEIGDRILCVGNPENDWFAESCGTILSGIETFGELKGYPSNAMRHSAYIQVGSSGGAAFDENQHVIGTTPGAVFSTNGEDFQYGVMIPVSEIQICLQEWGQY